MKSSRKKRKNVLPVQPETKGCWRKGALFAVFALAVVVAVVFVIHPHSLARLLSPWRGQLTLETLLERSPQEIEGVDIAEMNLLCAKGLPGMEKLDIPRELAQLDEWAQQVERAIAKYHYRFDRNPAEYRNSEALFKMIMLVLTLKEDLGVRYDPDKIGQARETLDVAATKHELADMSFFRDAKTVFLHGILRDRLGTCSSLPVLYVAIGRRLGFPVKLVPTYGHLFVRWEGGGEHFNIEGTGVGVDTFSDEKYKQWPVPISEADIARDQLLKSLTPAEELACFMELRAHCLRANERFPEALVALLQANRLHPNIANTHNGIIITINNIVRSHIIRALQNNPQSPAFNTGHPPLNQLPFEESSNPQPQNSR